MRVSAFKLVVVANILNTAAAFVLPEPQTPFQVTWETLELTDLDRPDPWNKTHPRRLMISKFSPVTCLETCHVPYMSSTVASIEDDRLNRKTVGPRDVLKETELVVCCGVKKSCGSDGHAARKFPTILFGPGFEVTRLHYSNTAQHIAGMGYEVIVMDHPYETSVVEFSDGTIILGGGVDLSSSESIEFGLDVRAADAAFILDTLGFTSADVVIHMGHSFGGAATGTAMFSDDRIAGGFNLDGTMFGPVESEGLTRPLVLMGSTIHGSFSDPSWSGIIDSTVSHGTWIKELNVKTSEHWSFYDMSTFTELLGIEFVVEDPELRSDFEPLPGSRMMEIVREYVSDFVEFVLRTGEEGLLAGPSELFEEVDFIV